MYKYEVFGDLEYDDNAEYILTNNEEKINLSDLLASVYMHEDWDKGVYVKVVCGKKIMFEESGILICKKNKSGYYSYHIAGLDLDFTLFNLVGQNVEVIIRGE